MNILFFLTPKAMCSYVDAGATLRQAMERMEKSGFSALPVLESDGSYAGVLTEGDLLWALKGMCATDIRQTETHYIRELTPRRVEDLISVAAEQNFVPVIDDKNDFIGIVTRSRILRYCQEAYFAKTAQKIS